MQLCARKTGLLGRGLASLPWLAVLLVVTTVRAYAQTPLIEKPVLMLQNGSANGYCRVAFSPDGKWLASSAEHGPIILWDAATGVKVREFGGFSATVTEELPTGGVLSRGIYVGRGGLAFSPNGKYVASSGKSIRDIMNGGDWTGYPPAMWEVDTGKPVGQGNWTMGKDHVAHHADFPWAPNEVIAWQFAENDAIARQFANYFGPAQTVSASGRVGARITEPRDKAGIDIYEVPSNHKLLTLPGPFLNAYLLALSPDGKYLALKHQGYGIEVWDLPVPKLVATLDTKSWDVNAETFSPDGKYLATAGDGDSIHIFETATWNEIFTAAYKQLGSIRELVFSADSKRLAGVDRKLHVWDVEQRRELYEIGGPPFDPITAVASSPDGQRLAVARLTLPDCYRCAEPAASVELWSLKGGAPEVLPKKTYELDDILFSPDSKILAATGQQVVPESRYMSVIEGNLLLWNLVENREVEVTPQQSTTVAAFGPSVSFSADGRQLVAGALVDITPPRDCPNGDTSYVACGENEFLKYARLLMVIDPATGTTTKELRVGRGNALLLDQSPDGQHVVSANEKTLRLWDLVSPKLDRNFEPQLAPSDQFAPNEYWLRRRERKFQGGDYENPVADALAYFPDGRSVVVAQDNGFVLVLDALTGVQRKQGFAETAITNFAFSPDGKSLVSTQVQSAPRIWDPQTLTSRAVKTAEEDCVSIAFSADGSTIVCGGKAGVILLWDAASGEIIARALHTPEGSWLVISAEGLFDGTADALRLAAWRVGNRLFALDQLPASFRHQGLLHELLAAKRPKPKEGLASVLEALAR